MRLNHLIDRASEYLSSGHTFYAGVPQPQARVMAAVDLTAFGIAWGAFMGIVPDVAAILSIAYLTLQIMISARNWWRGRKPDTPGNGHDS